MTEQPLKIIAIKTEGLGYNNQLLGLIKATRQQNISIQVPKISQSLITAPDGTVLHRRNYDNNSAFSAAVASATDEYLSLYQAPDFLLLPYDHAYQEDEAENVDLLAKYLKSAFSKHGYHPKALVLSSPLYEYEYIDLIHIGKHLLTESEEQKLAASPKLQQKVIATLGVPTNMTRLSVKMAAQKPLYDKMLNNHGTFKILDGSLILRPDNTTEKMRSRKNILFSIGGKTEDNAIDFTVTDAENLIKAASLFHDKGYSPIFSNTPRTPTDVTDFLYEQCQKLEFDFFNNKKICNSPREAENFRNYDGKYKEIFRNQKKIYGTVYPAILDVCELVVNTHDSFSYTSDAAAIGITSIVYTGNFIDCNKRPDCYKLFSLCQHEGYVIDLNDALQKLLRNEKLTTKKMPDVNSQIIQSIKNHLNS